MVVDERDGGNLVILVAILVLSHAFVAYLGWCWARRREAERVDRIVGTLPALQRVCDDSTPPEPRWRPHTHAHSGKPKHRYDTMAEAAAAARRISDDDLLAGRFISHPSPYECSDPTCGGFHVGNWSDAAWQRQLARRTEAPA
jgi:hypothetical protein